MKRLQSFESSEYMWPEEEPSTQKINKTTDNDSFFLVKNDDEMDEKEKSFFAPGSINTSVFTLVAATAGAGTITMPYVICVSGIGLGTILTIVGACLSHYTGNLLVSLTF